MERLRSLAPFCVRSGVLITGRKKIQFMGKKVAFVLISNDISKNSLNEITHMYKCPIVQWGTSQDFFEIFKLENTKIVAFKTSKLAEDVWTDLSQFCILNNTEPKQ